MPKYSHSGARNTTADVRSIDLTLLRQKGVLCGWNRSNMNWSLNGEPNGNINLIVSTAEGNSFIEFDYKIKKHYETDWRDMKYRFNLISVDCNYGGKRWFFECGLYNNKVFCGNRVRILYEVGDYFGCRKCANLSYESCNKSTSVKKGFYRILYYEGKAEEYYNKYIKRYSCNGNPTKKYLQYLKYLAKSGLYSLRELNELVDNCRKK